MKHKHEWKRVMGQSLSCKCGAVRNRPYDMDKGIKPQAKPSPLPWAVAQGADGNILITAPHPRGVDTDVAHVYDGENGGEAEAEANAALIVKAVNAHDGMVKLLSRILGMHETNNCGAYNGEAILSESVADEIRHTLRGINGR